ncbi:hypothetical protein KC573_03405, partial [candidate division WWE3 bacterium]|nr:hypothetical protein [candidate division WWE3 bacterium]
MRTFQRVWEDIRSGENIDMYVTVLVTIGLIILNLIGVVPQVYIAQVTLAVLALLAITSIGNRHRIEQLLQKQSTDTFYMTQYPPTYITDFENAEELWLIGVSMHRTVKTNYPMIERKLKQGHTVKVLLVHPEGAGIEMAVTRNYARREIAPKSNDIKYVLQLLCDLRNITPSNLEIRTIQYSLSYGVTAVNPDTASGILYLEHYCFRVAGDSLPRFLLRSRDGQWYDFYKKEINAMWDAGVP